MSTTAVVSAPSMMAAFVTQNADGVVLDVITGGDRVYVLHRLKDRGVDMSLSDPIDGELLVETRCFSIWSRITGLAG